MSGHCIHMRAHTHTGREFREFPPWVLSVKTFIHVETMVQWCPSGTVRLDIIVSLNTRKHLIQSLRQRIQRQTRHGIIITVYPLYQTGPQSLEPVSSRFIPETKFAQMYKGPRWSLRQYQQARYSHGIASLYVFSYLLLGHISKLDLR